MLGQSRALKVLFVVALVAYVFGFFGVASSSLGGQARDAHWHARMRQHASSHDVHSSVVHVGTDQSATTAGRSEVPVTRQVQSVLQTVQTDGGAALDVKSNQSATIQVPSLPSTSTGAVNPPAAAADVSEAPFAPPPVASLPLFDLEISILPPSTEPPPHHIVTSFTAGVDEERLYIKESTYSTLLSEHFDVSRFHPGFWQHAQIERRRVQSIWKDREEKGVWDYSNANITHCLRATPECVFGFHSQLASARFVRKCCIEHERLRAVFHFAATVAAAAGIVMWQGSGNLLGLVRHGGVLVPWDTDLDLMVEKDNKIPLKHAIESELRARAERAHASAGVTPAQILETDPTAMYSITHDPHHRDMLSVWWRTPHRPLDSHIEIWTWLETEEGGTVDDAGLRGRGRRPHDDIFPVVKCELWGTPTWCPHRSRKVLQVRCLSWYDVALDWQERVL